MNYLTINISLITTLIFGINLPGTTNGAKILGVLPNPGLSHYTPAVKFMKILAEAGHEITFITPYETKDVPKNCTWNDIVINGLMEKYKSALLNYNLYDDQSRNHIQKEIGTVKMMAAWVNQTLHHPDVRKLLDSNERFDAVIMEPFYNDPLMIFAHIYQCPLIMSHTMGPNRFVNSLVANPAPVSYIPHLHFKTSVTRQFTLLRRVQNLLYYVSDYLIKIFYKNPFYNIMLQQAFPNAPPIEHLQKLTSLVFLNSHPSIYAPTPIVPNMIEIGGYHVDNPQKLPKDLQEFLDSAKDDGVIYFSMGSHLRSKDMSEEKKIMLLNSFRKLKQKILWKFEEENLPNKPPNVLIKQWIPQQDVLAHPNIKLFITHGGLLSNIESLYHGIPLLAIPVFADQNENANKIEMFGYGRKLAYNDRNFSSKTLNKLLQELLTKSKYRINARKRSKLYHDRLLKPKELIVYWTEYVIRTQGAKHLMVEGVNLNWYEYYLIDVIFMFIVIVFSCYWITKFICKIFKKCNKAVDKSKTELKSK